MKKLVLSVTVTICIFSSVVRAVAIPVNILSSTMSVSGSYNGFIYTSGVTIGDSYSSVGSIPQSMSIANSEYGILATSSADYFDVFALVNHGVHDPPTDAIASASTETIFRPLVDFGGLDLYTDLTAQYGYFSASVFDVTNNTMIWEVYAYPAGWANYIYEYNSLPDPSFQFTPPSTIAYDFKTGNTYRIDLSAQVSWTHAGNAGGFGNLQAVPEPSTLLLLGSGLLGLVGLNRRRRN